jgi:hypothetical protein
MRTVAAFAKTVKAKKVRIAQMKIENVTPNIFIFSPCPDRVAEIRECHLAPGTNMLLTIL